ncbi:MAG: hypothetical protein V4719_28355 [Planctomycetota bacterium]
MTWENRKKTGARYYYRARRVGNRVVKEYVGSLADPVVQFLAREDRLSKAERRAQREANAEELRIYNAIDARITVLHDQLHWAVGLWLHGPVDRRIAKYNRTKVHKGFRTMVGNQRRQPLTREGFDELVKRAEIGDADALAEIRQLMRADPKTWRPFGDLSENVRTMYLRLMVKGNIVARESLRLSLDELHRELHQGHPSALRKLLVDQILILWLDVHYQQTLSAYPAEGKSQSEFLDKRASKSRKRYFAALEFLAKMDRILGLVPVEDSKQSSPSKTYQETV